MLSRKVKKNLTKKRRGREEEEEKGEGRRKGEKRRETNSRFHLTTFSFTLPPPPHKIYKLNPKEEFLREREEWYVFIFKVFIF